MPEASAIKDNADYIENGEEDRGCCDDGEADEAENCCGKSLRGWLVIANLITLLISLTEIIMGILVQTMPEWSFAGGSVGWLIIITGLFIFLVSFLGVYAGCKGSRADCWIYTYALVITTIFGLQIAAVALAFSAADFSNTALTKMEEAWTQHTTAANKEYLGLQFGCCAAASTDVIGDTGGAACDLRNDYGSNGEQKTRFLATCDVYPVCVGLNGEAVSAENSGCAEITYTNASANCPVSGKWDADYGASADPACAAYTESPTMPVCTATNTFDEVWYTTIGGANTDSKIDARLNAAFVNCYGRIESFLAGNIMSAGIGIIIYILWQLLLVLIAWMLACDCCNKKENIEDSAVNKEYNGVDQGV